MILIAKKLPIFLILTFLCGLFPAAHGQNAPLQIRLEKAIENARSITNVEIQYDDVMWIKGTPDSPPFTNDYTRTMHVTYIAAGGKYRNECRFESPNATNLIKFFQMAFDGKLWSEFKGSTASMAQQFRPMAWFNCRSSAPFAATTSSFVSSSPGPIMRDRTIHRYSQAMLDNMRAQLSRCTRRRACAVSAMAHHWPGASERG